jgi:hypothetical protein
MRERERGWEDWVLNEKCPTLDVGASLEWLKLIELSLSMIMGNIKHERCFSNMKSKLRNRFTTHLDLVFRMFA